MASQDKQPDTPVIVMNRLPVRKAYAARFEEVIEKALTGMGQVPGALQSWLLRPEDPDEGEYVAMTLWESETAFRAWTESDAFRRGHQGSLPREAYRGRNTVEVYDVVATTAGSADGEG